MEAKEYISSGILELYVYGVLQEDENKEISEIAKKHPEITNEILAIEKSIINLSTSFSPFLSAENFAKIKAKLELKHSNVIPLEPKRNLSNYIGWAAAIIVFIGAGYLYKEQSNTKIEIATVLQEKEKLNCALVTIENTKKETLEAINIIRDNNNTVVALAGQAVSPKSSVKVYWNKNTQTVYVDASNLPTPPKGKVYQVWSLQVKPSLVPTSIGLLNKFENNDSKIFAVSSTSNAQAFGITLEPEGGSKSPTMEQLYVLGTV